MAIIRFGFDRDGCGVQSYTREPWPMGAYCPLGSDNEPTRRAEFGAIVLWETHQGLCISEYERNGYDDSDWYMTVFDPIAWKLETILFATTRGWSYPSMGSRPDATPEVLEAYKEWREQQEVKAEKLRRQLRAEELIAFRQKLRAVALRAEVPAIRVQKLVRAQDKERGDSAVKLLGQLALRSKFRIDLRNQLISWLNTPVPVYESPFSKRQWACL